MSKPPTSMRVIWLQVEQSNSRKRNVNTIHTKSADHHIKEHREDFGTQLLEICLTILGCLLKHLQQVHCLGI